MRCRGALGLPSHVSPRWIDFTFPLVHTGWRGAAGLGISEETRDLAWKRGTGRGSGQGLRGGGSGQGKSGKEAAGDETWEHRKRLLGGVLRQV